MRLSGAVRVIGSYPSKRPEPCHFHIAFDHAPKGRNCHAGALFLTALSHVGRQKHEGHLPKITVALSSWK